MTQGGFIRQKEALGKWTVDVQNGKARIAVYLSIVYELLQLAGSQYLNLKFSEHIEKPGPLQKYRAFAYIHQW